MLCGPTFLDFIRIGRDLRKTYKLLRWLTRVKEIKTQETADVGVLRQTLEELRGSSSNCGGNFGV